MLTENVANVELQMKIDVVKHIVKTKLQEREVAKNIALNKARKQKLLQVLERKQDAALQEMDVADLQKMIDEL